TDAGIYGGSGVGNMGAIEATDEPWHGRPASATISLPPLGVLWLAPEPDSAATGPAATATGPAARATGAATQGTRAGSHGNRAGSRGNRAGSRGSGAARTSREVTS